MQIVVYDACVLYSAPLRDLLIRLAIADLVQAHWTNEILDETFRAIKKQRPELPIAALERTRQMMNQSVRGCLVDGYQPWIPNLVLPDPNDRHVLATAIQAGAQAIITINRKDFPIATLSTYQMVALHPDTLVMELLDRAEVPVLRVLFEQASALKNPPRTVEDLVGTLESCGLVQSMNRIRGLLS